MECKKYQNYIDSDLAIPVTDGMIEGHINVPEKAIGLIIFAHGSGSSRHSPRNNFIARDLNKVGFATLLMDLLHESEDRDIENRYNISLLKERLSKALSWALNYEEFEHLPIGLFGASTGAAAAIELAGDQGAKGNKSIFAVVSRGGRPDMARKELLESLKVPCLLIVGGNDSVVVDLNMRAYQLLSCKKKLEIVPGATHLFEEPGTLESVSRLSSSWFKESLPTLETRLAYAK